MNKYKIFNVMLTKRVGGIEKAFLNYNIALGKCFDVLPIVSKNCKIKDEIKIDFEEINVINKYDPLAIFKLRRLIKKHNPKVIFAHSTLSYAISKFAANDIPVIAVAHNYKFKHLLGSKYILALTDHMKENLQKIYKGEVVVVPNMIDLSWKRNHSIVKDKIKTIGFIGSLNKNKGADVLIMAFEKLVKKVKNLQLIIAGSGSEMANLENLARRKNLINNIKFVGWIDDRGKDEFFKNIDLLSHPSKEESFGIVFLEAMKYGVPIVTTRTFGAISTVNNVAKFCDSDDADSLANAIISVMDNKAVVNEMISEGIKEIEKYSIDNVSQKLRDFCFKIINDT